MQLPIVLAVLAALTAPILADVETVSFDNTYDNAANSLDIVACSDGPNGLLTKGFTTFGSLPTKFIGGAAAVAGFNSPECGSCWQLTFQGTSINVLAIDHTLSGFNIAQSAMDALTDNQAEFLGRINATVTQVDPSACGLS